MKWLTRVFAAVIFITGIVAGGWLPQLAGMSPDGAMFFAIIMGILGGVAGGLVLISS